MRRPPLTLSSSGPGSEAVVGQDRPDLLLEQARGLGAHRLARQFARQGAPPRTHSTSASISSAGSRWLGRHLQALRPRSGSPGQAAGVRIARHDRRSRDPTREQRIPPREAQAGLDPGHVGSVALAAPLREDRRDPLAEEILVLESVRPTTARDPEQRRGDRDRPAGISRGGTVHRAIVRDAEGSGSRPATR